MSEHRIFEICVEPIELCKLLKIADMVGGGGEAKAEITEGNVKVNNEVTVQKRKKIRHGDIVELNARVIKIALNPDQKSAEFINTVISANKNAKKKKKAKSKAPVNSSESAKKPSGERTKRKPTSV